ncbi:MULTISPECIES: hypothetical protein [unclassified Sulfitobacter]|uniref:hypothetical protein n=1 Tax=unclassified Sulfitobacter TaxID=196795 RepID=UPI0007C2793F|nr:MULTISPECIES: hypothetical protein [unclassified Sulfitobacter]KZY05251.1 hypothetical protein A3721_15075 [Sulfitobacter sp. HI0023]KZY25599.1 hypothetical protein A3728_18500 [Sulfitobacter sp. HI0040]KZZ68851.1 hypothetical protein A3764_12130 [Sulfitobacter sp. HI0129]
MAPLKGKLQSFSVPFPPALLSPNSRAHWGAINKAKKAYQRAVWAVMKEQKVRRMEDASITIEMTFYPPANYAYDDDNLIARMKYGRDTIASVIGVDDRIFRQAIPIISSAEPPHGRVQITLRPILVDVPVRGVVS